MNLPVGSKIFERGHDEEVHGGRHGLGGDPEEAVSLEEGEGRRERREGGEVGRG
jgi:hypothetical protein